MKHSSQLIGNHETRISVALCCVAVSLLVRALAVDTDVASPVVSYQYYDSIIEAPDQSDVISPLVSYQYFDSLANSDAEPDINSPLVSYQYYDWLGDENLRFQKSPMVSYFYELGTGAIVIFNEPVSQFVHTGGMATFTVGADGQPPLNYQWLFGGTPVAGATAMSWSVNNIQITNAGNYSVIVGNTYGSVTSSIAQLVLLVQTTRTPEPTQLPALSTPTSAQLKVFANGVFQSGLPMDPSKMTILLTHGAYDSPDTWPSDMATSFAGAGITDHANVVAWDWRTIAQDPKVAVANIAAEGTAFGSNLLQSLGRGYAQPIHFIGHSFGTLVNATAINYVHGFAPKGNPPAPLLPARTHVTLLDEAEFLFDGVRVFVLGVGIPTVSPIPDHASELAWIDNYVSAFAVLHPEARNVILTENLPSGFYGSVSSLRDALKNFHGYPHEWYKMTISTPNVSLMGNRWSFEGDGFINGPQQGTYFLQAPATSALSLVPITFAQAWIISEARLATEFSSAIGSSAFVVGNTALNGVQSGVSFVEHVYGEAIQTAGNVLFNVSTKTYTTINNAATLVLGATLRVTQFIPLDTGLKQSIPAASATDSVAYAWFPASVPPDAAGMSFDVVFAGVCDEDYLAVGINGTNVFALQAGFVADGVEVNSGFIDVSAWAGQTVEVFLGLMGGASTNGSVTVDGIRFYSLNRPTLSLSASGNQATVSWPVWANGYDLETTATWAATNQWSVITNAPIVMGFRYMQTNSFETPSRFYRLRKR